MSKGKPIKLSTTLFVFYAQSSRVGEKSYFLGMGKVWRSNSNLGNHPFLEKVFLASWASKCLEMPSQAIRHPCVFLPHAARVSWGILPHVFVFIFIFPWLGIRFGSAQWLGSSLGIFVVVFLIVVAGKFCFVMFSECAVAIHVLGVSRGLFLSSSRTWACWAFSLTISDVSSLFHAHKFIL